MKRPATRPRTSAHRALLLAAGLLLAAAPGAAEAQSCSFAFATDLSFGTYDPLATTPLDSTSTLLYRCPRGQALRVSLDRGQGPSFAARELRAGGETLRYNLYLDAARTVIWGDGTGGSSIGPGVRVDGPFGTTVAYVFGRVPAQQDPVVATYRDTIRVTFDL
jgi:spore coat protein U-like protein